MSKIIGTFGEKPLALADDKFHQKFNAFESAVASSVKKGVDVGKDFLVNGEDIHRSVDSFIANRLVLASYASAGAGAGIISYNFSFLPEEDARINFQKWVSDGADIPANALHSGLITATCKGRHSLAAEISECFEQKYGRSAVVSCFKDLDIEVLKSSTSLWAPYKGEMVEELCLSEAFRTAIEISDSDPICDSKIIASIAKIFGASPQRNQTWVDLVQTISSELDLESILDVDDNIFIRKHQSAAKAVVDKVKSMPSDYLMDNIHDDKSRLMMIRLGRHEFSRQLKTSKARSRSLIHDFSL